MSRSLKWSSVSAVFVVALVTSGALGASTGVKARASRASASQTFTVNVDGANKAANETFFAYYPNAVQVHPGDTVVFHYVGVGEPHTVALGTLADAAVSAFTNLTPAQAQSPTPPKALRVADAKLPQLFPQGPGDVIPSSANPCYLASGVPPAKAACPKTAKPDFNGQQSFYDSGWFGANARFSVRISPSTAPGTYRYFCLLHREFMNGKITVVPSSTSVPSPSAQAALGQKQLAAAEAKLAAAVKALAQGNAPVPVKVPATHILAGGGAQNVNGQIDEFGPKTIHIPVGGSVTWWLLGDHTITFNSTKANNDVRSVAPDGSPHLNPKAGGPSGGPGEPGRPPAPGKAKVTFKVVASQSWNGKGFHNSGVFVNSFGPPVIEGYKLTFTNAGTYKFICTVHDHMKGTVVVG